MEEKQKKYRIFGSIQFETWVVAESEEEAMDFAEELEPSSLLDGEYEIIIDGANEE